MGPADTVHGLHTSEISATNVSHCAPRDESLWDQRFYCAPSNQTLSPQDNPKTRTNQNSSLDLPQGCMNAQNEFTHSPRNTGTSDGITDAQLQNAHKHRRQHADHRRAHKYKRQRDPQRADNAHTVERNHHLSCRPPTNV